MMSDDARKGGVLPEGETEGAGSPVIRLVEGLADARARLGLLEASTAQRSSSVDAFRAGTEDHLSRQDAALAEVRRTLDALVQQSQREEQQRARMVAEQKRARALASKGHRETMERISASAVSLGLALAATLLGLLAASWSPRQRTLIFAAALVLVAVILVVQWWASRPKKETDA